LFENIQSCLLRQYQYDTVPLFNLTSGWSGALTMNADKQYARRGLEGPRCAIPAPGHRLTLTSRDILPNPEMAATSAWQHSAAENNLRNQKLADACIAMASLGNLLLAE